MSEHVAAVDLFIAVPTHGDIITSHCTSSLMAVTYEGARRHWSCQWRIYSGAVIYETRNRILADFMASSASHVLMVDSDQTFRPELVFSMVDLGKPVVGCMYPRRRIDFARIEAELGARPFKDALSLGLDYVGELAPERDQNGDVSFAMEGDFAKAARLGTGVLLIRRDAVAQMMKTFPELKGMGFPSDAGAEAMAYRYGLFNPMFSEEKMDHLSEDYSFCDRWRIGCEGEIWANVVEAVGHVGPHVFSGVYLDYLSAKYAAEVKG